MLIQLTNPRYKILGEFEIDDNIYFNYSILHPTRLEEALQSTLYTKYLNNQITSEMIEETMLMEIEMAQNAPSLIEKGRKMYGTS